MNQNKNYILLFSIIILLFIFPEYLVFGESNVNQIEFRDNKLSVKIENVALGSVLSNIQTQTGIKFLLDEQEAGRTVSVSFQQLPLEKALKRILTHSNHSLISTTNGDIQKVIIVGKSKVASGSQAKRPNTSSSSNTLPLTPATGDMKVTPPPDADAMVVTPPTKDMKVTPPPKGDAMVVTPPGGDMKVAPPSKAGSMTALPPE